MNLREQLRRDEGLRVKPYRCSANKLTIGYGRNLEDTGITADEAEAMLTTDIRRCTSAVVARIPSALALSDARRGVLVNMAFNLGVHGLLKFKRFLAALTVEQWDVAAQHMLDSAWAKQVGDRAQRLAKQMREDTWQ